MSPKTPKTSTGSPKSHRKTKKNVKFSDENEEFRFSPNINHEDIELLWYSKSDEEKAKDQIYNEKSPSLRIIDNEKRKKKYRYRTEVLKALGYENNTRENKSKRVEKKEEINPNDSKENNVEIRRKQRSLKIVLEPQSKSEPPLPEKKQGFLFRIFNKAKSLVSRKGGKNKTKKREHKSRQ
jgi:hypothetical protein